ncbi:L-arabinonate dehydratase [Balneatrix alpica]|uniref:L-arabinonate dehydratase n=1 Tax=Balneatrix alpica TaxID=75684 RepID=A0ABV5ZEL9_9GAMM|nr:L-arabinonate dehydratase [Balneatrix alpica]
MAKTLEQLRSQRWFADDSMRAFAHRQRTQQTGYRRDEFMGRPVIAIINTWSDISTCHVHLRERAQRVREGIIRAGGFPLELPALSLGEVMVKPTTMLYRNLLAMETEELLRSHPIDGAVLMGGCDKTTPALLMGAFSMNIPAIYVPAGATLSGWFQGEKIGTGTHTRKYWDEKRAGNLSEEAWLKLESSMTRSHGTCNTMGTASTMTLIAEAMGMSLPGAATIPAADSAHPRMCALAGERIVQMVWEDLTPREIVTRESLENAIITYMALGGSTNAAIHLVALAGRLGLELPLEWLDQWSQKIPVIANLMPAGQYLMEDLYYAGGSQGLLNRLTDFLHLQARNVNGATLGENIQGSPIYNDDVIRPLDRPISTQGTLAVLRGNLCPDGAVIKPAAATPELLVHRGRALVFENHAQMSAQIDDPALAVDANTVLVLKNAGPQGAPGMPEWGGLPIPKKLLAQGIRDLVRISDARMSGTHFGTCVLHVAPESYAGGPLALVQTGDWIELDVPKRRLHLDISEEELAARRAAWQPPAKVFARGYVVLYGQHVTQANLGCDFDFLQGTDPVPEPEIF